MPKIEIVSRSAVTPRNGYPGIGYRTQGTLTSRIVSPEGFALWLIAAELADGASVELPDRHGDEAFYVVQGTLRTTTA